MAKNSQTRDQEYPKLSELLSLQKAAEQSGLTQGHIRLLIRQGEIWGIKIGRNWVTTIEAVKNYQVRANPRGRPKRPKLED